MELILTAGLVSVILGTASGAQNVGVIGAFGVGGYIALAGLWGSPISGASMNPARTFGPDLASTTFTSYWVYIAGPIAGAVIAVGIAFVLRGRGGDKSAQERPKVTCSPRATSPASPEDAGHVCHRRRLSHATRRAHELARLRFPRPAHRGDRDHDHDRDLVGCGPSRRRYAPPYPGPDQAPWPMQGPALVFPVHRGVGRSIAEYGDHRELRLEKPWPS